MYRILGVHEDGQQGGHLAPLYLCQGLRGVLSLNGRRQQRMRMITEYHLEPFDSCFVPILRMASHVGTRIEIRGDLPMPMHHHNFVNLAGSDLKLIENMPIHSSHI